jgi:hypothetical protein
MAKKAICKRTYIMTDGTISTRATPNAERLEFAFIGHPPLSVSFNTLPEVISETAKRHGISQKIGDTFANAEGDVDYAYGAVQAMIAQLQEGVWATRGDGIAPNKILAQALARITGRTVDACTIVLDKLPIDKRTVLAKRRDIKAAIATIRAETLPPAAESFDKLFDDDIGDEEEAG